MKLRSRSELRSIKIGVMELDINNQHAQMVVETIKHFVPNAEIFLVSATKAGMQTLIDNKVPIVNMSASRSYATYFKANLLNMHF